MDTIYIHGLQLETIIGIYEWERAAKQPIILDIDIGTSFAQAIDSDDIQDCINYAEVAEQLAQIAANHQFQLVESFAEHMVAFIFEHYPADWVKLKLNKPQAIPNAASIGIIIERKKPVK